MAAAAESLAKRQDEHKRGTPPQSDSTGECPQARMRQLGVEAVRGLPWWVCDPKANGLTDDLANVSLLSSTRSSGF